MKKIVLAALLAATAMSGAAAREYPADALHCAAAIEVVADEYFPGGDSAAVEKATLVRDLLVMHFGLDEERVRQIASSMAANDFQELKVLIQICGMSYGAMILNEYKDTLTEAPAVVEEYSEEYDADAPTEETSEDSETYNEDAAGACGAVFAQILGKQGWQAATAKEQVYHNYHTQIVETFGNGAIRYQMNDVKRDLAQGSDARMWADQCVEEVLPEILG